MIKNYVIIGCGGVGTRIAEPLLRMILPIKNARLILVDGKDVRSHNLLRQFGASDIGINKAEALARHLRSLIHPDSSIEITAIPYYVEREFLAYHRAWLQLDELVLFNGVDNKPSRILLEDLITTEFAGECFMISGGNEEVHGQATLAHVKNRKVLSPLPSHIDPEVAEFNDTRMPSQIPCDELTESEPQLAIGNMGTAWTALGLWYSQVVNRPTREDRRFNYAHFDARTPEVFPKIRTAAANTH